MKILLSHTAALDFWRDRLAIDHVAAKMTKITDPSLFGSSVRHKAIADRILRTHGTSPLDVIVSNDTRRRNREFICHRYKKLPSRSVFSISRDVYVVSPELLFVQCAETYSPISLALLGCELCGSYVIDQDGENGFFGGEAVTSAKSIQLFTKRAQGLSGIKLARVVSKWVVDNSRSPMESKLAMLLSIPRHYGGYGLTKPELNKRIDINQKSLSYFRSPYFVCDLYWEKQHVAVEYNSDAFHLSSSKMASDADRQIILESAGVHVIPVTNQQLHSQEMTERLVHDLSKRLYPQRHGILKPNWSKHQALRFSLFGTS